MKLAGSPPIDVTVKTSGRSKRMTLRVSKLDGRVTLTIPTGVPKREAMVFLEDRSDWIRKHLSQQEAQVQVGVGARIVVEGQEVEIYPTSAKQFRIEEGVLRVPGHVDTAPRRIKAYLKGLAQDRLLAASDKYSAKAGVRYGRITLRDTRSRWGSCSSQGNLNYSWRLIMAPPDVLDYVAAHEVAHLVHMNHSSDFWTLVERICPEFDQHRVWLRQHGGNLHKYRFGD